VERLVQEVDGSVRVDAWGPGAEWLVEHAPTLTGGLDDDRDFDPGHPLLRELHARHRGLRLCRSEAVFEAVVPTIIEQKVVGAEALTSWRRLARALGEAAPGPLERLLLPPSAERLAPTPSHVFHTFGLERRRADTIRRAALSARRLEEALGLSPVEARARLRALPGMGVWTAAEVAMVALGDPDAVSVGDYHLPHLVSWALAGEPRGGDERMLELLEPFRGHRGRVLRLLAASGIRAPRYGPGLPLRDVARM
jgi:3-methyladenine DNA glycosylase/8-oxoguanine DNA glycosylase